MFRVPCMMFALAAATLAQAPAIANSQAAAGKVPQDTVVAVINAKPVTAAEVDAIVAAFPKAQQQIFQHEPKRFLQEYAQMQVILQAAEKQGLAKQTPYKEQLADLERQYEQFRRQVLYSAALSEAANRVPVSNEEIAKRYQASQEKYREAKVKLIYIPFTAGAVSVADKTARKLLTEAEARTRAESIAQQARSGADFVKLVSEHSEDAASVAQKGDLGTGVRAGTDKIPADMRTAILASRQGDIVGPVRSANGFYVFRIESISVLPLEQVRDDIYKEIQNAGMMNWLAEIRGRSSVKIENEAYFSR
ncbi:MAG TPA: peptidylprolyl isomerase [Bryobacteraceae bacterium]|nr:peptidylprolyl isomerase [Bryobacteraceae bacterium]